MTSVKPFRGVHYNLEKVFLKQVISPIAVFEDSLMKEQLMMNSQYNILHLLSSDNSVNKLYKKWIDDNILIKSGNPKIYIYEQQFTHLDEVHKRTSFVALCEDENENVNHLPYLNNNYNEALFNTDSSLSVVPTIGLYADESKKTEKILSQVKKDMPLISAVDCCGIKNTIWIIEDEETINVICNFMADKKIINTYGYGKNNKVVSFVNIFDEGGKFFNNYRVLKIDEPDIIREKLNEKFNIFELNGINFEGISMKIKGKWFGLILEDEFIEKLHPLYRKLNTYVLHEIVFNELLDLKNNFKNFEMHFVDEDGLKKYDSSDFTIFKVGRLATETLKDLFKTDFTNLGNGIKCYPDLQMGLIMYDGIE